MTQRARNIRKVAEVDVHALGRVILTRMGDHIAAPDLFHIDAGYIYSCPAAGYRHATARARFDLSSLDLVLHGAAPVALEVKQRMIEWLGPILVEYWGASECGVCTLADSAAWLAHPGTVGRALPHCEVFAVDDTGTRLPAGEVGLLYCRRKQLARVFEYHRDPKKTARAYLEPGVFTIGDIGHVDADGWVHLTDRLPHMIISGGVNIYPAEVEQVLQRHPAVHDVCVFGTSRR